MQGLSQGAALGGAVGPPGVVRNQEFCQGSFCLIEHLADLGRETGEVEGLHDQFDAGSSRP